MKKALSARMAITALSVCILISGGCGKEQNTSNPAGVWQWSEEPLKGHPGSRVFTYTLTLKLVGGKLSGSISVDGDRILPIEEAQYKGDEVSFHDSPSRFGGTLYVGHVSGNTIHGHRIFSPPDNRKAQTTDWVAARIKN